MSLYLCTGLVHIFDLCKKRLATPISHAKILIVFLLFSIGGIGNTYAAVTFYSSQNEAYLGCAGELSSFDGQGMNPSCYNTDLIYGGKEFYVSYTNTSPGSGLNLLRSSNSHVYTPSTETTFGTKEDALLACEAYVGVFVADDHRCVIDEDNKSPYYKHYHHSWLLPPNYIKFRYDPYPPPSVSISSPTNGSTHYNNVPISFSASASDSRFGDLSGEIRWSIFDGENYSYEYNTSSMVRSFVQGHYTISAYVFIPTGWDAQHKISITINAHVISIAPLQVTMDSPHETYKPVTLYTSSATINGGNASGSLVWHSSIDGAIGVGGSITPTLSPGDHIITASLSRDGNSSSQQLAISIINDRPHLSIDDPVSGRIFDIDDTIQFQSSVLFQGAPSTGAVLSSWVSNIDGAVGSGASFSTSGLSEGKHEIALSASENGEVDAKTVYLTVYDKKKNMGSKSEGQCFGGNPINLLSGNKYHEEMDYTTATELPLYMKRSYNSTSDRIGVFGQGWSSNVEEHVNHNTETQQVIVVDDGGAAQRFDLVDGAWVDTSSSKGILEQLVGGSWRYTLYDGTVKNYNAQGQILSINKISGLSLTFNYVSGRLDTIIDEYAYSIGFSYNPSGFIESITVPGDSIYEYSYSGDNLEYVVYPDKTPLIDTDNPRKQYLYENLTFPHALTGLVDEEGIRFATWDYDDYGRANLSEHALYAEKFQVFYNLDGTVTTENALGKQTTYDYESINGILKVSGVTGHQSANCAASWQGTTYDPTNGFANVKTDWRGNQLLLDHNEYGQVTSRTVVDTGADWTTAIDQRTETATLYNNLQLPWVITKSGLSVEHLYTPLGRLDLVTATDTTAHTQPYSTNGQARILNYDYTLFENSDVVQFVTVDGARNDVSDITSYEYDAKGNLIKITNALNQVVEYKNHNGRGQPGQMIGVNGLVTDFVYSTRGWLETVTVRSVKGDAVKRYTYYDNGLVKTVTQPNSSILSYYYNAARQLDYVENNLGEVIDYEPNSLNGEWGNVKYLTAGGVVRFEQDRLFDELGRVRGLLSPDGLDLSLVLDPDGNVTQIDQVILYDGTSTSRQKRNYYDALNRLRRHEADDQATVHYDYDVAGNLVKITASGESDQVTSYIYNGFGERIFEDSPATGDKTFYYDAAGNAVRVVNNDSQEIIHVYDAINRIEAQNFTGATSEDVIYSYDERVNGIGRLTGIIDQAGSRALHYDDQGYLDRIDYSIELANYSVDYNFNLAGELEDITYPSLRQVFYRYDALGRIDMVESSDSVRGRITIVDNVEYEPFGPVKSYGYGNGFTRSTTYDLSYKVDDLTHGSFLHNEFIDYANDTAGRIRKLTHTGSTGAVENNKHFEYDAADRLKAVRWSLRNGTSLNSLAESLEYDYDLLGNRTAKRSKAQRGLVSSVDLALSYSVNPLNNQLDNITLSTDGGAYQQTHLYNYTGVGNVEAVGARSHTYNRSQRVVSVDEGTQPLGSYLYNASGQRVRKSAGANTTHFHYGLQGELFAESDEIGAVVREYIYFGGMPVAMVTGDKVYENVESTPNQLVGRDQKVSLNSRVGSEGLSLQAISGDSEISGFLSDESTYEGKESYGLTIREQQDGLSGVKIDVTMIANNVGTLDMIFVTTPEGKQVPIPMFGVNTEDEMFEITIRDSGGNIVNEVLERSGEWVKLERVGNFVNVLTSLDGQTWTQIRSINLPMVDDAYIGVTASNTKVSVATDYVVANDNLFFLHADHLGSVYKVSSNASKNSVWQRSDFEVGASPFGDNGLPSGEKLHDGLFEMPLRFPGQYFDGETGTHYNYFRDYDPGIGRYVQSDPIGLLSGMNTYVYVDNQPQALTDKSGLCPWCIVGGFIGGGLNAYSQYEKNDGFDNFDWGSLISSTATGALGGGLGTLTKSLSFGKNIVANSVGSGVIGASVTATENALTGSCKDVVDAGITSAVLGGVGSGVGNGLAALGKGLSNTQLNNIWNNATLEQKLFMSSNAITGPGKAPFWTAAGVTTGNVTANIISNANQ